MLALRQFRAAVPRLTGMLQIAGDKCPLPSFQIGDCHATLRMRGLRPKCQFTAILYVGT